MTPRSRKRSSEERSVQYVHEYRKNELTKRLEVSQKAKNRLSEQGRTEDALALGVEEGRDKRRNASGSCK